MSHDQYVGVKCNWTRGWAGRNPERVSFGGRKDCRRSHGCSDRLRRGGSPAQGGEGRGRPLPTLSITTVRCTRCTTRIDCQAEVRSSLTRSSICSSQPAVISGYRWSFGTGGSRHAVGCGVLRPLLTAEDCRRRRLPCRLSDEADEPDWSSNSRASALCRD